MSKTTFGGANVRGKVAGVALVAALTLLANGARAETIYTLVNPNWEIDLTDFGYSDYLGDLTPGFEGREYLSGEWGAAVGYTQVSSGTVSPKWLEPNFIYPDWTTNSNFSVVSPIAAAGTNAQGLPVARSIISNGALQITQDYEMVDTVVGTPMGTSPASAGGAGSSIRSNRYVLLQTYTLKNTSGEDMTGVQFFQLLHGLNAQSGVYDDRLYAGPMSSYRYDVTLRGVDPYSSGAGSSADGLEDYIGFHATTAPTALEIGRYGIDDGTDDHLTGKPSDGVHLSVEDNWLTAPYAGREGTDSFAPALLWVAGAQRWDLGSLASGESVSFSVVLSILTGTRVTSSGGGSGSANGGSYCPGGVDFSFDNLGDDGNFYAKYSLADTSEIAEHVAEGEFTTPDFLIPGQLQLWDLEFSGSYDGAIHLVFAYDPSALPPGTDESLLDIYHFDGGAWVPLGGTVDIFNHTISVNVDSLSPFAVGEVPEPGTLLLLTAAGAILTATRRRRRAR
ncbi:MAG: hypothetical protein BIFFINMI_02542 [Phycisphaerae bacterium]|nr:hypothetical protein [Phycisphaerae bacterium]